jgi:hypothetical protein
VGAFPDSQSALNLAAARLRHIAGTAWSTKRYLNIELVKDQMRGAITERFIQTCLHEWAYAQAYHHSRQRTEQLPYWPHRYNWHRPHTAIGC